MSVGRGMRVAFVGASHWHLKVDAFYLNLAREAGLETVGVSDDDESIARSLGAELGCRWSTDAVDLLERTRPDFVVATPRPDRAASQMPAILEMRIPTYAEKPLGLSGADVWPLVEAAERGWVTVAFPNRCLPLWTALDRLATEGLDTRIIHASLVLVKGNPSRYVDYGVPWMRETARCGGGPLRNFGVHYADLLNWRFGPGNTQVRGASLTRRLWSNPIEDYASAVLQTADGAVVTWEVGYSHVGSVAGVMEFRLATPAAHLTYSRAGLHLERANGEVEDAPAAPGSYGYPSLFADTLARIRRGDPPLVGVRDCALANDLVDAAYLAAGERPLRTAW